MIGSAAAAVMVYALLWIGTAQHWDWLVRIDAAALDAAYRYGAGRPGWVTGWDVFCTVFGPMTFRLVAFAAAVVAAVRRNRAVAVFLLVTVVLNGLLIEAAKWAADRTRPDTAFVAALSTSFPSGHAVGVLLGVSALATVCWPWLRPRARIGVVVVGAAVIVAVGVGRVVLNVHHPSDVVAGWALGYAYFVGWVLLVPPWRPVRPAAETPAVPDTAR